MLKFIRQLLAKEEAIPILRVSKASDAVSWYSRLGFLPEWEHRFEPGLPAFVSVHRRGVRLFLSEHTGDARPDTLVYLRVKEVESISRVFGVSVTHQPWADEVHLMDPDGNRVRVGAPK